MIKNMRLIVLNRFVLLLGGVLACLFCFGGCSEPVRSRSNMSSTVDQSELEFQRNRDRPPTVKTLYAMADILATQGKDPECEFMLKRIIQEHPQFFPAYNSLAELQLRQGRVDEAIDTIARGLRIHPRDPVLLNNLGMCWMVHKDYKKALEMFTKAAGVMPANTRYRANMAVALGLLGRYEESLSLFRQVLPEDQANHNLSVLREVSKNAPPASTEQKSG
jgi:Flp pilus assembly protein TadD